MTSAFDRAVKMLAGRSKSRSRLEQGLLAKGHPADEIAAALDRLTGLGYLDDAKYAAVRARAALAEGRSPSSTVERLEAEGVDRSTAQTAVDAACDESAYDEKAAAAALLKKRRLAGPRALRFLLGRGYSEELARELVPDAPMGFDD